MRADRTPLPGQHRAIGPGELFFSITDRLGRITAANSVFGRLSAFGREELLGAPHNVIRHPEMPGGAFHLMWQTLLDGRPFAAYVRNLAKDRVTYDVFATVTPLGDGFLSVRSAPQFAALRDAAHGLYAQVTPMEQQWRAQGASAAVAAEQGAAQLGAMLGSAGFPSYPEFMYTALPAEVTARIAASGPRPHTEDTGPIGQVLTAALEIDEGLVAALARLDTLQRLVDSLSAASAQALTTAADLAGVTELAGAASATVASTAPVLDRTARAMTGLATELTEVLTALAHELAAARLAVMEQRFQIALARLHNDMVLSFAAEVLSGQAPPEGMSYVPALGRTLGDDLDLLAASAESTATRLAGVSHEVELARERLERFRTFLSTWRIQVPRYGVATQLGGHVAPIDAQLKLGHGRIADLRALAQQCQAEGRPLDTGPLVGPVWRILEVASVMTGGRHA